MIGVLRIVGHLLEENCSLKRLSTAPYRKDINPKIEDRPDVFYYDIADCDISDEFLTTIGNFIELNASTFESLANDPVIELVDLDIGLIVPAVSLSLSLSLHADLISRLGSLGISLSISAYKGTGK